LASEAPVFVRADFFAQPPAGERAAFFIAVGAPRLRAEGEFSCTIEMGDGKASTASGIDGLQALALALSYMRHRIELLLQEGWTFFIEATATEPFDPREAYLPRAGSWPWETPR